MSYQQTVSAKPKNYDDVVKSFHEAVVKTIKIDEVRKMILLPRLTDEALRKVGADAMLHPYPYSSKTPRVEIPIDEYADYLNVTEDNAIEKAALLGAGCGILYNALIKNARMVRGHKVAWDLLANKNLHFNYMVNAEPSVADPLGLIPGWISFRFYFASSNSVEHLCIESELLKKLEQR